jgi:hypothetical protein
LQVWAKYRFDRPFPAGFDHEVLCQPALLGERLRLEPVIDLLGRRAKRCLLQRFEGREPPAVVLELLAKLVEVQGDLLLLLRSC